MKVLFDGRFDYKDSSYFYNSFDNFLDDKKNLIYVYGIFAGELPNEYKNKIYLNIEEPNGLYHSGKLLPERELNGRILNYDWDVIYQICPYSTEWLNKIIGDNKYKFIDNILVCDSKYFPNINEPKIFDVMYQGSIHGYKQEFSSYIDIITKFNYIWTSLSDFHDSRKTHIKLSYIEKLKLHSKCKITIIDNLLYDPHPNAFATNIRKLPQWNLNEAFSHIDYGIMPQLKGKFFESMICKVLVLVQRGPWNIMEKFGFTEGEHFLYFDDPLDLNSTIQGCLAEWNYCEKIVEKAYNKIITENSIDAIYNKYLKQYDQD